MSAPWADWEVKLFVPAYLEGGTRAARAVLPHRSKAACKAKAASLKLHTNHAACLNYTNPGLSIAFRNWRGPAEPNLMGRAW